jgi:hypothetical protein
MHPVHGKLEAGVWTLPGLAPVESQKNLVPINMVLCCVELQNKPLQKVCTAASDQQKMTGGSVAEAKTLSVVCMQ